jgi:hypothetical protein
VALGVSLFAGGAAAVAGLYAGLLFANSLLLALLSAWVSFVVAAHLSLLMTGMVLRLNVVWFLLPRSR